VIPPRLQGYGLVLVSSGAWGLNWPVMKLLMLEWPPFWFRIICASVSVSLLLLALSEPLGVRHMAALALALGGIALASRG
jgi:drug/metabolite transporter (DMT)-like permease